MMKMMTFLRTSLLLVIAVVLCSGFALIGKGYQVYKEAESQISLSKKVQEIRSKDTFTSIEDLPETYVNAVVAVEDKRFFTHPGIDFLAVGRALLHDIQAGRYVEGGSTITQQLAKNLYFSQEKQMTPERSQKCLWHWIWRKAIARMRFLSFMSTVSILATATMESAVQAWDILNWNRPR